MCCLSSPHRERSRGDFSLASEDRRTKPPTPRSPQAAWLRGLCRLLLQRFLLLLLFTLPADIIRHWPALSFPQQVSLRFGSGSGSKYVSIIEIRQHGNEPHGRSRSPERRSAALYQPRHLQPRERQTETQGGQAFNQEALQRRWRPRQGPFRHTAADGVIR